MFDMMPFDERKRLTKKAVAIARKNQSHRTTVDLMKKTRTPKPKGKKR